MDNHDGVINHPEPDILECVVKWSVGSTAANKASGGDGISAHILKSLKILSLLKIIKDTAYAIC